MSDSDSHLPEELDPYEWSEVLDDTSSEGSRYIFQHTLDVAFELSQAILRRDQLWLDVGCGTGHLAQRLSAAGANVIGLDRDPAMLEFARHRWHGNPAGQRLNWIRASAEQLPLRDAAIDGLVATSLTGYLSTPREFFKEVHRVLRDEGYAVLTFTNRTSWLLKANHFVTRWTKRGGNSQPGFYLHTMAFIGKELGDLGFVVSRVVFYNFVLHMGRWLLPSSAMGKRLEHFGRYGFSQGLGRNFVVVARKAAG
jgi:SAM-dependent methyltransferase